MKALVLYKSKTGFTKKYAEWIGQALQGDVKDAKEGKKLDLSAYDVLIYGGYCHAGFISGVKPFLKAALPTGKKVAVFATGASPAENLEIEPAMRRNFTDDQWNKLRAFYLPGGLNYEAMGAVDKALMAAFRAMTKKQEGESSEMYQMLCKSYDLSDEKYIQPLVEYCQGNA